MDIAKNEQFYSFTIKEGKKLRELKTRVGLSLPFVPKSVGFVRPPPIYNTIGLWDTGASGCAITQKTINSLSLKPIRTGVAGRDASGEKEVNLYLLNLYLPNNIVIPNIHAVNCTNESEDFGILIGMDVITLGDFSVTNVNGLTSFSFRIPSVKEIDYTKETPERSTPATAEPKISRNGPCPCGKPKKYKHCCGA